MVCPGNEVGTEESFCPNTSICGPHGPWRTASEQREELLHGDAAVFVLVVLVVVYERIDAVHGAARAGLQGRAVEEVADKDGRENVARAREVNGNLRIKVLSVLLASAMVASLAACGSSNDAPAASTDSAATGSAAASTEAASTEAYNLEEINVVVNGTLTATVDNGQAEFVQQWDDAVSEAIGHPIKMNVQQLDHSGYTDAVGRLFAGGDYPDVMIMSADMFKQYAPTGLLWDMSEAYANAKFQSHLILPEINENLKDEEGHLYGFAPTYGNGCVTYVKQAWLDAVGLKAEDIKTYDDYYNMLLKFHNEDPDGNGVTGDTYGVIAAGFVGNDLRFLTTAGSTRITCTARFWLPRRAGLSARRWASLWATCCLRAWSAR